MAEQQSVALQDLNNTAKKFFEQKAKIAKMKEDQKAQQEILDDLESKILSVFEAHEMEKLHIPGHGLLYETARFTVPTPKSLDDKTKFFDYLKERGIFFEMASVNSQTLNSFYKAELERAVAEGNSDFKLPGIGEPSHVKSLSSRKS